MKVGLITYHSAYNFGSVLQAYATQETIKKIVGNCEIINYRTKEQKKFYSIFKWNKGFKIIKSIIKNFFIIFKYKQRKTREIKFEKLFNQLFDLSELCVKPNDVSKIWNKYDIIVSGSDQVWNKHSNELNNVSWEYMYPYLLKDFKGKKISYASSPVNMNNNEISKILDFIKEFNYLSFRERYVCEKFKNEYNIECSNVLDPTFLLTKEEWIKKFDLKKKNEDYILYYSLGNIKEINTTIKLLNKNSNTKIKAITPLNISKSRDNVEILDSVDPIEFLELIYNANKIITDSYHGTILSVNFGKDIYSICRNRISDLRKTEILTKIGLENRIIEDFDFNKDYGAINYEKIFKNLNYLRKKSFDYLNKAFGGEE